MNDREIEALYRSADQEFNQGEPIMLVPPIQVMALVEQLRRCERQRAEAGMYNQLAD